MHPRSLLFRREPVWQPVSPFAASLAYRSWLEEPGSLTARLRRLAGAGFGVRLLGQGMGRPFVGELGVLGLPERRLALTREVLLFGIERPLVLARTVMPPSALRGEHCALARLGNRPLGEVLFAQRGLRRPRLEFAKVLPMDWLPGVALGYGLDGPVWGRRSLYEVDHVALLVCEFFLPAVLSLEKSLP